MSSQARKLRRAQERHMVRAMRAQQRAAQRVAQAGSPPQPAPRAALERTSDAERLAAQGIQLSRSILWTPPGSV